MVSPDLTQRTRIVIPGAWNPSIFSPQWVREFLLEAPSGEVLGLDVNIAHAGTVMTFNSKLVSLRVSNRELTAAPQLWSLAALREAEVVCSRALQRLPETPLRAFGINFGFDIEASAGKAVHAENPLADASPGNFLGELRQWTYELAEDYLMVLATKASEGGPTIAVDFNHHRMVKDAKHARKRLDGAFLGDLARTKNVLADAFQVQLEPPDDHDAMS